MSDKINDKIQKQYFKTDKAMLRQSYKNFINKRLVKLIDGYAGDIAAVHMSSPDAVSNLLQDLENPESDAFETYLDGVETAIVNAIRSSAKARR